MRQVYHAPLETITDFTQFIAFPSQADVNVPSTRPHDAILLPAGAPKVVPAAWTFIPSRDQRNFKMNEEQCNKAFPELFREIERAADFWAGRGGIRLDEVDISWQKSSGILRVLIFDQQASVEMHIEDEVADLANSCSSLRRSGMFLATMLAGR